MNKTSDAQFTIGKILDETARKDAVHFALAPMIAFEYLWASSRVKLMPARPGYVRHAEDDDPLAIGVTDPFLRDGVEKGQRFWVFLNPNTITNLRHDWEHPAFVEQTDDQKLAAKVADALLQTPQRRLLEDFAEKIDVSYADLLAAADNFITTGEYLSQGPRFEGVQTPVGFWPAYDFVTQTKSGMTDESFFSCSC